MVPFEIVPLAVLAIAIFAMLLLYGITLLIRTLANAIPNWGIPGLGNLRSAFLNGINVALAAQRYAIDLALAPLAAVWHWMVQAAITTARYFLDVITDLYTVTKWVAHVQVPGIYGAALTFTQAEISLAEASATSALNTVHGVIDADIQALQGALSNGLAAVESQAAGALAVVHSVLDADIQLVTANLASDLDLAERYAQSLVAAAFAQAQQDLAALETTVTNVTGVLTTDIGNAVNIAERYTDTAVGAAITGTIGALTTDVDNIIDPAWQGIIDDVHGIEGVIGTDLPDILNGIKSIPTTLPVGLVGVAAISIPLARTVATYLRECGVPNCINLSQLGKDLQALLGLVEDASFLSFIVELIHNPTEADHIVNDVFGTVLNDTVATARQLISL
jgi:hypothetical protein